jgi:uncharacterized protein involved in high-affinity Fe2+ transport
MTVRAKFYVTSKLETSVWTKDGWTEKITQVKLAPVYASGGDKYGTNAVTENHIFGKHTPSGEITMSIANQAAADGFETGKAYYIDFTPAPA